MSILHLSDEQLEQVFRAMRPLPVRDRHAFLQAVADGLRGKTIGDGEVSALSVTRSADSKRRPTLISRPSVDWVSASTPEPRHELLARAQLAPNHERLALHRLKRVAGFEIYAPRIRSALYRPLPGSATALPRLCFMLFVLQWHAAKRAPG